MKKIKSSSIITAAVACLVSGSLMAQQQVNRYDQTRSSGTSAQGKQVVKKPAVDTVILNIVQRQIIQELPADQNALIKIINSTCNLDIRPWSEAKVKMVTTVGVDADKADKMTDEEMLTEAGLVFKSYGNRVDVQTRPSFSASNRIITQVDPRYSDVSVTSPGSQQTIQILPSAPANSVYTLLEGTKGVDQTNGTSIRSVGAGLRTITLYVPDGCRLDVDNRNTAIVINADIKDARFKLSRSSLGARNFGKLFIRADYYTISISDVDDAQLELESGNFTAGVIRSFDLDSKSSEIDYEGGETLYLRSQADRITLDEIARVAGRKVYGDLRVGKLTTDLDIEGVNADIKIRAIAQSVERVKINDQYADLRLPVRNITNYDVSFTGSNSTVFTPFAKIFTVDLKTEKEKTGINNVSNTAKGKPSTELTTRLTGKTLSEKETFTFNEQGDKEVSAFKATSGDITGKHTKFLISCSRCSVDFK